MVAKTIKEIIIMLLVSFVTMLALAIALYQYAPSKKIVPETVSYQASTEVMDLLEDDIDTRSSNRDNVILTYEVTSSDLNNYQTTKEYVPGKANPFSAYVETITEEEANGVAPDDNDSKQKENTNKAPVNTTKESTSDEYFKNTGTK